MCSFPKKLTQFSAPIGKTDPRKVVTRITFPLSRLLDGQVGGHFKYISPVGTETILLTKYIWDNKMKNIHSFEAHNLDIFNM